METKETTERLCPKCKADWDGGSILDVFKEKRSQGVEVYLLSDEELEQYVKDNYSPPYRFGREIGIEIEGGYDGTSFWQCPDCKTMFDRWTGKERGVDYYTKEKV